MIMKTVEIKDMTVADLTEKIAAEKENLRTMKLNHAVSPLENPGTIKSARRNIARMMTVLGQKNGK